MDGLRDDAGFRTHHGRVGLERVLSGGGGGEDWVAAASRVLKKVCESGSLYI